MSKKKTSPLLWVLVGFLLLSGVYGVNYGLLQHPLTTVVQGNPENQGIRFFVHYGYFVNPSELVIDVWHVDGNKSAIDVFRVLLQYAQRLELQGTSFSQVKLASKGKVKFVLTGAYFKQLGQEYGEQNPMYTARTFAENVYTPGGERAFESWTGGLLGVAEKQLKDFKSFHQQWYIGDLGGTP
jgi:hypothetical protein